MRTFFTEEMSKIFIDFNHAAAAAALVHAVQEEATAFTRKNSDV